MTGRTPLAQGDQVEPADILRAPLIAASAGIPPRSGQHSAHGRRGRTACACHPVGTGFRSTLDLPSCIGRPQRASSRACPNIRLRPGLRRTGPPSPRASADRSPSGMPGTASIRRASPAVSLSMRWRRLTRQRMLRLRSRLAQMPSMISTMVPVRRCRAWRGSAARLARCHADADVRRRRRFAWRPRG